MQRLLDGYARFRTNIFPEHSQLFATLAKGQKPQALFITCSDSRVVPEMIMQCEPGDLFPCRNAGNLVPPPSDTSSGVAATIEYAVRVLKVPDVVVCGHSDCGAMKGLMNMDALTELPTVRSWLEHAGPSSRWLRSIMQGSGWTAEERLKMLTEVNVITQLQNLAAHPAVAEALRAGTLRIHGWVYDIASGAMQAFDAQKGEFEPLMGDPLVCSAAEPQQELQIA